MGELATKPLAGKRVVVTRAAEQSQPLMEALREAGANPVLLPLVVFAASEDLTKLDHCLNGSDGKFDWVFFTSQNAVRALQERCAAIGRPLPQALGGAKVATVGSATAEAAQAAGLSVAYVSKTHNGGALALELAAEVQGKRIFLPRSDRANPDLITALKRLGADVHGVVAYKTVAPRVDAAKLHNTLFKRHVDAILFFSPSAAHHLRELIGVEVFRELSRQTVFMAIGPVSEKALREEGVARVLQAADTAVGAAIAALVEFFNKAGQAQPAGAKQP